WSVTGVQTCALPICGRQARGLVHGDDSPTQGEAVAVASAAPEVSAIHSVIAALIAAVRSAQADIEFRLRGGRISERFSNFSTARSEERRVGKEGGSR